MRWKWSLAIAMAATVSAWTCRSAAEGATARSTDVAGGDTNQPKNQRTDVAVVFEASAADLPQTAIRDAIAHELGMPRERTVVAARRELSIGVEGSELVVRFTSPEGRTERRVALPDDPSQTPELLRLIAGNVARDQDAVVAVPPRATAPPVASAGASIVSGVEPSPNKPAFRRHWVGLHVAQDFMYEPGTFVCDAGALNTTYSCYLAGTGQPYVPSAESSLRSVQRGFSVATTRLLASYDYALSPAFTLGGRVGFAFGGGPAAAGPSDGVKGTPFLPLHLEARGTWWFAPLTNRRVRGFAGLGAGVAQFDAKSTYVTTCPGSDSVAGTSSDGCGGVVTAGSLPPPAALDVWRKVGQAFVDVRGGLEVRLWDELGVELDLHMIAAFPAFGVLIEPSLGVVYGL